MSPARVVAPTSVKGLKSTFSVCAEGPWPMRMSSFRSSMAA